MSMMIGNMEEAEEEDLVEKKEDVEEARVEVIGAGSDAMNVESLDTLHMNVQTGKTRIKKPI